MYLKKHCQCPECFLKVKCFECQNHTLAGAEMFNKKAFVTMSLNIIQIIFVVFCSVSGLIGNIEKVYLTRNDISHSYVCEITSG